MKQTAVECLKQDIDRELKLGTKMVVNWDMYLQMEKQQIIDAYWEGSSNWDNETEAEQYYNEQFKNK